MGPDAVVVTGPYAGISLTSGITSSRNHKRPFFIIFLQAFVHSFRHQVSVNIMHLRMCTLCLFITKHNVLRDFSIKSGRFIHVIPYSFESIINQPLLFFHPPLSYLLSAKIRVCRLSRPDNIGIYFSILAYRKITILFSLLINIIRIINLNPGIQNCDCFYSHIGKFFGQSLRLPVSFCVKSKYLVLIHIINIKMDGITRDL